MEQEIRTIRSFIDQQKARVSEALTWAFHVEEKYGDCAYKIGAVQKNRLTEIFKAEQAHATDAHDLMTVLARLVEIQGYEAAQLTSVNDVLAMADQLANGQTGSMDTRLNRAFKSIQTFLSSSGVSGDTAAVDALSAMLRISFTDLTRLNLATIPSDKENFCERIGGQEFCGFDRFRINEDGGIAWEYQKADFDFRVVSFLKDGIAPFVKVSMPAKFEDLDSVSRKKVHQIVYRDQVQSHYEQVFRLHNNGSKSFSDWIESFRDPKVWTDKLAFLTEIYQLGEVELFDVQCLTEYYNQRGELPASEEASPSEGLKVADTEVLPEASTETATEPLATAEDGEDEGEAEFDLDDPQASDVCRFRGKTRTARVSPQRLTDSIINLIHLVGMDRDEVTFIERMGRDTFHSHKFYQKIFLDTENDRLERTIFEKTFEVFRGSTFHQGIADNYYRQFNTMGHILFAVPDSLVCSIRENFKRSMDAYYFETIHEFVEEAKRREAIAMKDGPIAIQYEVGRELGVRNSNGEIEYLSRRKLEDYRIATDHFHKEITSGFYQKEFIETQDGRRLMCGSTGAAQ